jgi:HK97 family phage portal protein
VTSTFKLLRNSAPVPYVATRNSVLSLFRSDDKYDQMRAMGSVGTLFAIVNALSQDTSQVSWHLYRKQTDARRRYAYEGQDARVEVLDHMALRVWNKPNPFMTRQEFVEIIEQHRLLTGESWMLPSRMNGVSFPTELWPVRPDRMEVDPDPRDYLKGYVYRSPDGQRIPLGVDEVILNRTPNPCDPYRGWGAVQSILADLDATKASAEWNRNFFRNSAAPGGVIKVPEGLNDREFSRLQMQWNEQHKGVSNAHRVAILENGMDWVDRSFSQRDMQFVELRAVSREVIREAFRFPVSMLGTSENVNRANADAAELMYSRWLIKPALERLKQMLNNEFLPMFGSAGQGVEFDYEDIVPEDREAEVKEITAKSNAYVALVTAGADPELTAEWLCIPDLGHTMPVPAPQPAPAAVPAAMPPEAVPAALNGHKKLEGVWG